MENKKVVFVAPWKVELQNERFSPELQPNEVIVKKIYTMVSAGTELSCLSGTDEWFQMPGIPGYSAVSEIIEIGTNIKEFEVGDIVFHYGTHTKYEVTTTEGVFLKVPKNLELKWVPFTRMATIAMTSIRTSQIELGDFVSVTGQGIVGNMAAQLAKLQGARVIGLDISENRLELARQCGLYKAINSSNEDSREKVLEITNGLGVSTAIEATGIPKLVEDSLTWIANFGEIILLGTPRGEYNTNATKILQYCHLAHLGSITFKGAHEWRYPVTPNEFIKHSLVRNSNIAFQLLMDNMLVVDPLISHVIAPEEAQSAYDGLRFNKDEYNTVLFNWQ
ncbi:zinc-binding alcohol dehydrogenase [Sporosarcina sp. YIM B06819]|uniref:zinc-dependent alcohol dehydrogenase n=1 Tax=Sporosarcina sp. YIM B06819 TaxID=3081769 RepID=UPI00298CD62D|nr:zinc-binding alcohol dehydrogenase [Sporosarcina sp. YIM B06819]